MRVEVLGPLAARENGRSLAVGAGRQRALFALFVIRAGSVVTRDQLVDALWPEASASQSLDAYLSRLRRALREAGAEGRLERQGGGYVLHVDERDAADFEAAVVEGRAALGADDPARASSVLADALAIWRGPAYADVAEQRWAQPEASRLEDLRLGALEDRLLADLRCGRHVAIAAELEPLTAQHPTRERLVGHLMLSRYRSGRQADALAAYSAARNALVEQLGLEPGRALRELQAAILAQDRALDLPPQPPAVTARAPAAEPASRAAAEHKLLTVLFADIVGSMDLAEALGAEGWRRVIEPVYEILCDGVRRFEGTVDTFTGDGIMALFGAPIAHEDHARRACYAALHVQRELAPFAERLRREQDLELELRIGLHSGEVIAGAIGEDLSASRTVIGHAVGLARRMEALAEPGTICLSETTAALVEGHMTLVDLGETMVKGSRRPLRIHRLTGVSAARGAIDVARARGLTPLVSRDDELAVLTHAFAAGGQVVGIVGEAGVGKSRLSHEYAERCRARGVPVYHVGAQAHTKSIPLMALLGYLRAYFAIAESDDEQTARDRITTTLLGLDQGLDTELPLIYDFLGVPDPVRPVPSMDPEARQRKLFGLMKRVVRAASTLQPAVTLVEDLHWLDPASEAFLAMQVEAIHGTGSMMVLNFRPEYRSAWSSRTNYRQIALGPLDAASIEQLLDERLGNDASLSDVRALIADRTRGNPFFIEELVRSLVDTGTLTGERGDHRLSAPVPRDQVPASVQTVLAARIDRLAPDAKEVLAAAAVIGREFSAPILEKVMPAAALTEPLTALLDGEFIFEQELFPEVVYSFRHPLTHEVAYRTQLSDRRAALHAAVAQSIASHYPADQLDERAALIAEHWEGAGNALEAARWHARAARRASTTHAADALRHWRRVREHTGAAAASEETVALGITARILEINLGWRLGISLEESERTFREAEQLARDAGDVFSRAVLLSVYGAMRGMSFGDIRGFAELAREAIALADEAADPALYMAIMNAPWALVQVGAFAEADAFHDRALAAADGDLSVGAGIAMACPYAFTLMAKGFYASPRGDLEARSRLITRGVKMAYEHDDLESAGWGELFATWIAYVRGFPDEMAERAAAALATAARTGGPYSMANAYYFAGLAARATADWAAAIEALERCADIIRTSRTGLEVQPVQLAELGLAYLGAGSPERALELVNTGVDLARARGQLWHDVHATINLASVLIGSAGLSAADEIERALDHALEVAGATGAKAHAPLAHVERAALAELRGDGLGQERELRRALALFEEVGADGHTARLRAQLSG